MTGDFAIIAEGITDQLVLKNVILGFFDEQEEPVVNFAQPLLDATSKSTEYAHGGWTLVRQYFQERKFLQALQLNKYLVVHIDADIAADLGIELVANGQQRTPAEFVEAIIEYFRGLIGDEVWNKHHARFVFAIGIDAIECWLLPLVFDRSNKKKLQKTTGCLDTIDRELRKKNRPTLSRGESKDPDAYRDLSEDFKRRADVEEAARHNPGFQRFVHQLGSIELSGPITPDP
jgi:hypothetical protein